MARTKKRARVQVADGAENSLSDGIRRPIMDSARSPFGDRYIIQAPSLDKYDDPDSDDE